MAGFNKNLYVVISRYYPKVHCRDGHIQTQIGGRSLRNAVPTSWKKQIFGPWDATGVQVPLPQIFKAVEGIFQTPGGRGVDKED